MLLLSAEAVFAYGNPTGSPVSRGIVPPSSYSSGLVNTANPIDNTTNQIVTGNVAGAKYFHGNIPYGSTTSFGSRLGSTSLDSFLRYSAVPEQMDEHTHTYSPFYSQTGTVAKIPPGYGGVFAPGSPKVLGGPTQFQAERPADVMAMPEVPQPQVSAGKVSAILGTSAGTWPGPRPRPPSTAPDELQEAISNEPGSQLTEQRLAQQGNQIMTPEEYQRQLEQLHHDLDRVKANASELEESLRTDENVSAPSGERRPMTVAELVGSVQPQRQSPVVNPPADRSLLPNPASSAPDVSAAQGQTPAGLSDRASGDAAELTLVSPENPTDRVQVGIPMESGVRLYGQPMNSGPSLPGRSALASRIDAIVAPKKDGAAKDNGSGDAGMLPAVQRVEETARAFDAPARLLQQPSVAAADSSVPPTDPVSSLMAGHVAQPRRTESVPPARAEATDSATRSDQVKMQPKAPDPAPQSPGDLAGGDSQNSESFLQERFGRYVKAAELYLRQGRYCLAADSFTLASMYKPDQARAYIGKSHASFAAGQYIASAVALAKAVELDSRNSIKPVDLMEIAGGPDQFVVRITELEHAAKTGETPLLQLLLAYIYHQMDRPQEAAAAIRAAKTGLPTSVSVDLLQAAIGASH
ncbi:MAG: hypothetical protein A2Y76_05705 [Planctomycetes bacterium RBG_13_60_9]|nr:MAG: hypothetical protein A2Y76_05705 [Planctomycetes bacterium RBG_13_60_9]